MTCMYSDIWRCWETAAHSHDRRVQQYIKVLGNGCTLSWQACTAIYMLGNSCTLRVQELCETRGGRPGFPVLMSLMVSVDVKQHWTTHMHWSQFVPNMSTDIRGHEAPQHHHQLHTLFTQHWANLRALAETTGPNKCHQTTSNWFTVGTPSLQTGTGAGAGEGRWTERQKLKKADFLAAGEAHKAIF